MSLDSREGFLEIDSSMVASGLIALFWFEWRRSAEVVSVIELGLGLFVDSDVTGTFTFRGLPRFLGANLAEEA